MAFDAVDRKIITLLQLDGRLTSAAIAEKVNLSLSACHRRVQLLQESGVIAGYGAKIDRHKIGLSVKGFVFVKMESHDAALLKDFLAAVEGIPEVITCHAISGDGDYLLEVMAADMDAFAEVSLKRVVRLPGVKDSRTNFVLSTVAEKGAWPIPEAGR